MSLSVKKMKAIAAILAINILEIEEQNENRTRKWWVKPFLAKRLKFDVELTLLTDLLVGDSKDFNNFIRITYDQFEYIHEKVRFKVIWKE